MLGMREMSLFRRIPMEPGDRQAHIMSLLEKGISTTQAATRLGITERAVRKLVDSGTLPAHKIGREWFIDPADLERATVKNRRPGRPKR